MTEARRRTVPLRSEPAAPGRASAEALARLDRRWRPRYLMLAPHRLGFFLAMLLLMASGLWWALVQIDRVSGALALPYGVAPSLVHAAVMTFGFMPLFFAGFLFTAGPKWLHVEPWPVSRVMPPLLLQAGGWLVWLAGGSWGRVVALAGCFIGVAVPGVIALGQFGLTDEVITLILFLSAAQFLVGNVLEPQVMGTSMDLSPYAVLISLTVWTALWGIAGAIAAIPITAVMVIVLSEFSATRPIAILLSRSGGQSERRG